MKVLIGNDPFEIIDNSFHKPGKGQAFSKIKLKNLGNGKIVEKTLKIGESLDGADVQVSEMQYLYNDEANYFFMNTENFDQVPINKESLGDNYVWLKGEENDFSMRDLSLTKEGVDDNTSFNNLFILSLLSLADKMVTLSTKFLNSLTFPCQL